MYIHTYSYVYIINTNKNGKDNLIHSYRRSEIQNEYLAPSLFAPGLLQGCSPLTLWIHMVVSPVMVVRNP